MDVTCLKDGKAIVIVASYKPYGKKYLYWDLIGINLSSRIRCGQSTGYEEGYQIGDPNEFWKVSIEEWCYLDH